jgi:HEAT repeat protein
MDAAAKIAQKRRETILYGIDSEIVDLLGTLDREKDGEFNADLEALFGQSTSDTLRATILRLFSDLEWKGAEKSAMAIVTDRDMNSTSLVYGALSYLAAIRSKNALSFSADLVKEDNKKLLPALIRLMGRAGGAPEEAQLLSWFDSDNFDQNLRDDTIKALGEIGSAKAAAKLDTIVEDSEASMPSRVFACQSLAKIKDPVAIPSLVKAANGDDPNVRAAAVEALSTFVSPQADAAIVQALRDSVVNVRIAACKAVGTRDISSAFPFLRYKATSDPDNAVRMQAYKSLALLGGPAFAFLRERLEDSNEGYDVRALCFGLLASKDPAGSMQLLQTRLIAESAAKDRTLYTDFAREVANASDAPQAGPLAKILLADKDFLIRIAGVEWIRKNKAIAFKGELETLSKNDPSGVIRQRAAEALSSF